MYRWYHFSFASTSSVCGFLLFLATFFLGLSTVQALTAPNGFSLSNEERGTLEERVQQISAKQSTPCQNTDGIAIERGEPVRIGNDLFQPYLKVINNGLDPIYYDVDRDGKLASLVISTKRHSGSFSHGHGGERKLNPFESHVALLGLPFNGEHFSLTFVYKRGADPDFRVLKASFTEFHRFPDGCSQVPN